MHPLLKSALSALERQIEPWRMRVRMARVEQPRPSREALVACWRDVRRAAKEAPRRPVTVPLGPYRVHGHNAADLLDVFYEIFIAEGYASNLAVEAPFIVDCGANVGLASVYFKLHFPLSRLVAFEPHPGCAALWRQNVEGNGFTGAELVEAAVGRSEGRCDLHFAEHRTLGSSIFHTTADTGASQSVRVVRLSAFLDRPVDLLKIDVEGAEQDVLEELAESDALARVHRLMIEYHHRLSGRPPALSRFLAMLEQAGFTYKIVSPERGRHFDDRWQSVMIYAIRPQDR